MQILFSSVLTISEAETKIPSEAALKELDATISQRAADIAKAYRVEANKTCSKDPSPWSTKDLDPRCKVLGGENNRTAKDFAAMIPDNWQVNLPFILDPCCKVIGGLIVFSTTSLAV